MKKFGGVDFVSESAGLEPGNLNPLAIEVMKEDGIDISNYPTNGVFDYFKQGKVFQYVITVCDGASADKCPIFPSVNEKIGWDFPDPSKFTGTQEEKLKQTRKVRDQIKLAVLDFIRKVNNDN